MKWEQWVLIAVLVVGAVGNILMIGEIRKPTSNKMALVQCILASILIYLVVRI